ncbi:hypothetical protein L228DRAFT_246689 [Xylona heveae TC161]|uniref:Uncharacterized protein n=1 Tax=Xylona heveae (strain CBS 132557 / TC161) TaxID=1328760 RepID=A0A165HQN7_XYLHT|nr:hypothetical protein L228DRAFT_246689 [Xylona heveae TC161]KZF23840.1 hypothetical protein L228DRAFT_246689 [Xylona heveae TC161]
MHFYFDYIPKYVDYMQQCGFPDAEVIEDAWLTMVFRAFCWHRCHDIVEGSIHIPSRFYGSQQPVFIG